MVVANGGEAEGFKIRRGKAREIEEGMGGEEEKLLYKGF
jgi:hypothetical protein